MTALEYTPLSPTEIAALLVKEQRGELTPEDTKRFIESTRASFLARPVKAPKAATPKLPPQENVDFF
jgi:hypothetical protein